MTKEQLEKLYKANGEKEVLDIISKEGIELDAEDLEMVNGGTPLRALKDIFDKKDKLFDENVDSILDANDMFGFGERKKNKK